MNPTRHLLKKPSTSVLSKVWNATIRMPELRPSFTLVPPILDIERASELVTDIFQQYKGQVLVLTGAGK